MKVISLKALRCRSESRVVILYFKKLYNFYKVVVKEKILLKVSIEENCFLTETLNSSFSEEQSLNVALHAPVNGILI